MQNIELLEVLRADRENSQQEQKNRNPEIAIALNFLAKERLKGR